jgi:hypothetical protein
MITLMAAAPLSTINVHICNSVSAFCKQQVKRPRNIPMKKSRRMKIIPSKKPKVHIYMPRRVTSHPTQMNIEHSSVTELIHL